MPLVSVIVPNYNHAPYLEQRLESVFGQSFQDFEVILLDDCSTDQSVDILEKYASHPKVTHFVINEVNSGSPFKQWKKGIDLARGEFIWIAESDDVANTFFLSEMISPFLQNKNCVLSYCRSPIIDCEGQVKKQNEYWSDGVHNSRWKNSFYNSGLDEIKNYLIYRNTIPNASACIFRKSDAVFDAQLLNMKFCGDWLFWGRLLSKGFVLFNHKLLSFHRSHENSTRAIKDRSIEAQRFIEYFIVISSLRKDNSLGDIRASEMSNYKWIISSYDTKWALLSPLYFSIFSYSKTFWFLLVYEKFVFQLKKRFKIKFEFKQ